MMIPNPFAALGLPERPDLDDETVRAAWRAIAAATHPDREDGGDLARYTLASAAFAELRTPWGRSEAYADLVEASGPRTVPLAAVPAGADGYPPRPAWPWRAPLTLAWLPSRIRRGRPLHLLTRAVLAAGLCLAIVAVVPGQPAAPAEVTVLITWFVLAGRKDLAPPPER